MIVVIFFGKPCGEIEKLKKDVENKCLKADTKVFVDTETEIDVKPMHKVKTATMYIDREDGKLDYFRLLQKIKNKEIDVENVTIEDNNKTFWKWDFDTSCLYRTENGFNFLDDGYKVYLSEQYTDLELLDLLFTVTPIPKNEIDYAQINANNEIIDEIERAYMDLDMQIDNCQGCMEGLDTAFAKLKIYKSIVKFLGGDIDSHLQELTDRWFDERHKQDEKEKLEKEKEQNVIEDIKFPLMELANIPDELRSYLWDLNSKVNEICKILQKKFK